MEDHPTSSSSNSVCESPATMGPRKITKYHVFWCSSYPQLTGDLKYLNRCHKKKLDKNTFIDTVPGETTMSYHVFPPISHGFLNAKAGAPPPGAVVLGPPAAFRLSALGKAMGHGSSMGIIIYWKLLGNMAPYNVFISIIIWIYMGYIIYWISILYNYPYKKWIP